MSDGATHSGVYRSTFLGYTTPREIVLYQRLHSSAFELMLTETHEEIHFHLFQSSTFGFVQGLFDQLIYEMEIEPDLPLALFERRLVEADYRDFLAAYQVSLFRALRTQESTAAFCELCIAEAHNAHDVLLSSLPERSKQYGIPIDLDCDLFRSRLSGRYRTKALRGQVVYNIARVALNRRLEKALDNRASLGAATRILLCSGPPPDEVYAWFVTAFQERWPEIEALLDRAENAAMPTSRAGRSIDLVCVELLQNNAGSAFYELEEAFKVAVLEELEQFVSRAFDTTPDRERKQCREDVFGLLAPLLKRHGWTPKKLVTLERPVYPPVKMSARNFATRDVLAMRVTDEEVAEFVNAPVTALWSICLYPFVTETISRFGDMSLRFSAGEILFSLCALEVHYGDLDHGQVSRINWPGTVDDFIPVVTLSAPKWPLIIMVNGGQNDLQIMLEQQAVILTALKASNKMGNLAVIVDTGAFNTKAMYHDGIFATGDRVAYTELEEGEGFGLVHLRRADDIHIVWSAGATHWSELQLWSRDKGYPSVDDLADIEKVIKIQLHLMVQGALLT